MISTQCRNSMTNYEFYELKMKTMNSLSLKYERFTLLGYKDIEIRKFEIVAKSQFL